MLFLHSDLFNHSLWGSFFFLCSFLSWSFVLSFYTFCAFLICIITLGSPMPSWLLGPGPGFHPPCWQPAWPLCNLTQDFCQLFHNSFSSKSFWHIQVHSIPSVFLQFSSTHSMSDLSCALNEDGHLMDAVSMLLTTVLLIQPAGWTTMLFSYVPFGVTVMVLGCPDYLQMLCKLSFTMILVTTPPFLVLPWWQQHLTPLLCRLRPSILFSLVLHLLLFLSQGLVIQPVSLIPQHT